MKPPDPRELPARLRALPAAAPLMRRLGRSPEVFVVGGAVRDLLLGGTPSDLDLVVEGDPARVLALLDGETISYDRFGTSTVSIDGFTYDLVRARRETYPRPGALPEVVPADLEADLSRRDFTVNAMAVALGGADPGELRGFPGALADLSARRLRVLHERSFIDDPTRLLRLARYRARLAFEVEDTTLELVGEAVRGGAVETISRTRIGNELRLLAREPDPAAAFQSLSELGIDRAIDPRFGLRDVALAERAAALLPPDGHRDRLMIAIASLALPEPDLRQLLDAMGFETPEREVIVNSATRAGAVARGLEDAKRASEIACAASGSSPELIALAGALGPEAAAREWLERLRHVELEIGGRDLLAAGVPEGPALGVGLRAALRAKLDGEARSRDEELAVALEATRSGG